MKSTSTDPMGELVGVKVDVALGLGWLVMVDDRVDVRVSVIVGEGTSVLEGANGAIFVEVGAGSVSTDCSVGIEVVVEEYIAGCVATPLHPNVRMSIKTRIYFIFMVGVI